MSTETIRDDDPDCRDLRARKLFGPKFKTWMELNWHNEVVYCACPSPPLRVKRTESPTGSPGRRGSTPR